MAVECAVSIRGAAFRSEGLEFDEATFLNAKDGETLAEVRKRPSLLCVPLRKPLRPLR